MPNAVISGSIETNFLIETVGNAEIFKQQLNQTAYIELLRAAKEKYGDTNEIDIVDITWLYVKVEATALDAKVVQVLERAEYTAMGKVIKY